MVWYLWLCILTCYLRATAEELLKEYKACESADYITYVGPLFVGLACLMVIFLLGRTGRRVMN